MVIIRNIANGPFEDAPSANGAQRRMNFIAGETWLVTNWATLACALSGLPAEPVSSASRNRDANFFVTIASQFQKRSTSRMKTMGDAEPILCARQEPA